MTPPRSSRRFLPHRQVLGALLLAVLTGVGCSDPVAPSTVAPAGFSVASDAAAGVAVALPEDWTQVALSTDLEIFDAKSNQLRIENPKLSSVIVLARIISGSGGVFMAASPDGISSVNLTAAKSSEPTLDDVAKAVTRAHLENQATDVEAATLTVADQPAVRLSFKSPVKINAEPVLTDQVQYMLLKDGRAFILTFMETPQDLADQMVASLRIR
ncbi:MAG: hypothetical protein ACT4OS_01900 [Acidimicrobiales bacterium]